MQSIYYTIYKTTNLLNQKIYIGKHITRDLNDGYIGSGKLLKRAISKYGIEHFSKEILHIFDNEAEMNAKEAELVTEEFVIQESNYNLCEGGRGGFSYINRNKLQNSELQRRTAAKTIQHNRNPNPKRSGQATFDKKVGIFNPSFDRRTFLGKKHSEVTKQLISNTKKGSCKGENNSQYGTTWITNGIANKKVKINEVIPEGWYKGRKMARPIIEI